VERVKLLDKTFRLVSAFSIERPEWGVSELAGELRLPKSTVHRITRVLTAHRYLSRSPATGRLRLGLAALELGRNAHDGLELRRLAQPVLERLAVQSGETILLMVLDESRERAVCIERAESRNHLRLILEVGTHAPLHAGASSKVLLAYMAPAEIERVIARGLPKLARGTITRADTLRRDLMQTRRRGYARSVEETNDGAAGLAVPILAAHGLILAGLSIVGPLMRFGRRREPEVVALARQGAAEIRAGLGLAARAERSQPASRWPGSAGLARVVRPETA
jgi:DNA-binding IclR family transcriptional regulator